MRPIPDVQRSFTYLRRQFVYVTLLNGSWDLGLCRLPLFGLLEFQSTVREITSGTRAIICWRAQLSVAV